MVEPVAGPFFAEVGGGEEPVDLLSVGLGTGVGDEGADFLRGGGETDEVEGEAAKEGGAVSFGGQL